MTVEFDENDNALEIMQDVLRSWLVPCDSNYDLPLSWLKNEWVKYVELTNTKCSGLRCFETHDMQFQCGKMSCPSCWFSAQLKMLNCILKIDGLSYGYSANVSDFNEIPTTEKLPRTIEIFLRTRQNGKTVAFTYNFDKSGVGRQMTAQAFVVYDEEIETGEIRHRFRRKALPEVVTYIFNNKKDALQEWLDGLSPPWAGFGNEDERLNFIEDMSSFRYWFRSLKVYKNSKVNGAYSTVRD